jgi:hypothetical protein
MGRAWGAAVEVPLVHSDTRIGLPIGGPA